MKKLLTLFAVFVLVLACTFSAYSTDMNAKSVVKASVLIKSDSAVLSGKFSLSYDSSLVEFKDISSSDFVVEVTETEVIFVSKSGVAVKDSRIKLEFERLKDGEVVLNIDSAAYVDESKKTMSADSVSTEITLAESVVVPATEDECFINNATADSLIIKADFWKRSKPIFLLSIAFVLVVLIAFVQFNKEKNCADSK